MPWQDAPAQFYFESLITGSLRYSALIIRPNLSATVYRISRTGREGWSRKTVPTSDWGQRRKRHIYFYHFLLVLLRSRCGHFATGNTSLDCRRGFWFTHYKSFWSRADGWIRGTTLNGFCGSSDTGRPPCTILVTLLLHLLHRRESEELSFSQARDHATSMGSCSS